MWAPGTLVVCVDAGPRFVGRPSSGLVRGRVYTIAGYDPYGNDLTDNTPGVYLKEVVPPDDGKNAPTGWWMGRFRPVSDTHRKIVRDLLAPVPPVEEEIARAVRQEVGAS